MYYNYFILQVYTDKWQCGLSQQGYIAATRVYESSIVYILTRWTCRRWRNTSSVSEMLDELEWPSLEARRDQSSLLLFHKIHCGAVSIEKDKYDPRSQFENYQVIT